MSTPEKPLDALIAELRERPVNVWGREVGMHVDAAPPMGWLTISTHERDRLLDELEAAMAENERLADIMRRSELPIDHAADARRTSWTLQSAMNLTLRDLFAAAALAGQLANPKWPNCGESGLPASEEACAAHWSYVFADAMLREREKP